MEIDGLSRHDAKIFVEGYCEGIKSFGDVIGFMEDIYGYFIPCSELKRVINALYEGHMKGTMSKIMSLYNVAGKE